MVCPLEDFEREDEHIARRARVDAILSDFRADLGEQDRKTLRRADADLYDDSGLPPRAR